MVFRWETLLAGKARLVPREGQPDHYREIEGTPDWVLEVVSDSSVKKDTKLLGAAYHRAGIPEYWIVDARGQKIFFQILLWQEKDYVTAAGDHEGWQNSNVFARGFRLTRQREELGLWEYTLEVRLP